MNIATYELLIPFITNEPARRSACAIDAMPVRPARWSPIRWLRARRAATRPQVPAAPDAITVGMIAADALTKTGIAGTMPRIDTGFGGSLRDRP